MDKGTMKEKLVERLEEAFPGAVIQSGGTTTVTINPEQTAAMAEKGREIYESGDRSNAADKRLQLLVERIERLLEERKGISDDVRDVYQEAKSAGYDAPTIRECIKLRAMDRQKRKEREHLLETYQLALGL